MEFNLDAIAEVILSAGETASVVNVKLCYDTEKKAVVLDWKMGAAHWRA